MTFDSILTLATTHGYSLIFLLMIVQGPITTAASSFGSALGYFNIYIIFLLAIFGNLIPDLLYYTIGYYGRKSFIDRHKKFFGFKEGQLEELEKITADNVVKSLLFSKLVPFFAMPGLITAGALRVNFWIYLRWVLTIIFFNSLFFVLVGYYFGSTYRTIVDNFDLRFYHVIGFLSLLILIVYGYKKMTSKLITTSKIKSNSI